MLVSHDRYLLDRVSTRILGLDGKGGSALYADCEQWEQDVTRQKPEAKKLKSATKATRVDEGVRPTLRKLSYLENREWEQMEGLIQEAEGKLHFAQEELQNPEGASQRATMEARYQAVVAMQAEVDRLYGRWAELEAKLAG